MGVLTHDFYLYTHRLSLSAYQQNHFHPDHESIFIAQNVQSSVSYAKIVFDGGGGWKQDSTGQKGTRMIMVERAEHQQVITFSRTRVGKT